MFKPIRSSVPSESTIEQLSNHHLLRLLGSCYAWFFVPTKNEEKILGYDASLQGYKALVIQYKRLIPSKAPFTGRIDLNLNQHKTLLKNFPKKNTPYAFYAFSLHQTYRSLENQHIIGAGCCFGSLMVFIDIHSIPVGTKSLTTKFLAKIKWYDLFSLINEFSNCKTGIRAELLENIDNAIHNLSNPGKVTIFWAPIPK